MRASSLARPAAVIALLLLAGCSQAPRGAAPSVASCRAAGVSALRAHVTVTVLPQACGGLSAAQVNAAVAGALRTVAEDVHGKARMRGSTRALSPLLAGLIRTVPAPRAAPPGSTANTASGRPSRWPLGLAALLAWLATAGFGLRMLLGWIRHGGPRRARLRARTPGTAGGPRPSVIFAHAGLAAAGLPAWIAYLVTGLPAVAWAGCAAVLPVMGLGVALISSWLPEGPAAAGRHPPAATVAVHGLLAITTTMLVLLAAIGLALADGPDPCGP